jgi:hypothetical protein
VVGVAVVELRDVHDDAAMFFVSPTGPSLLRTGRCKMMPYGTLAS